MGENTGEWVLPDDPKLLDYSGPPYYFDEVLHPGQVLINYAERKVEKRHVDRGWHLWPWEYGRLNICWHRALTKLVQKTCGRCCGHSLQETRSPGDAFAMPDRSRWLAESFDNSAVELPRSGPIRPEACSKPAG